MRRLVTAIRTLTILRVPGREAANLSDALPLFPVAGLLIGLVGAGILWSVGVLCYWAMAAAVLCVAATTWMTGGLHLDGWADAWDATGGRTRERRLEIMKDPRVGSFGVTALVLLLLFKFAMAARLVDAGRPWWAMVPFILSRGIQVAPIVWLPYARAGEGTGRAFVEGARPAHAAWALGLALAGAVAFGSWSGLIAAAAAGVTAAGAMAWMRRTFGGVTGDLIGFTSEAAEAAAWLSVAAAATVWPGMV